MRIVNLNRGYWAFCAIGERMALPTRLEFPDYNMRLMPDLFASCVPVESTLNLYSGPSLMDKTACLLVVAD